MPSRDYFLRPRSEGPLLAYENFAVEVAKLLGAKGSNVTDEIKEMVDFEVALANVCFEVVFVHFYVMGLNL